MTTSWMTVWPMALMGGPAAGGQSGGGGMMLGYMVLIFALFYFMLIRPQQRKEKQRRELIQNTKTGDRVIFSGGIIGTVTNVKEHTFMIKVADNVKIEVLRGAVVRVLERDEKPAESEDA